ncbi:MAG: AAA family ATPase [Prevotellaceae bacterium]|nr:AAA family ATPase [Prevotellaceae bacterium]
MDSFFKTHKYLLEQLGEPLRRGLMDEADWQQPLIGIEGSRGVGKTTLLLMLAKELCGVQGGECLYLNLNSFYFQTHRLSEVAQELWQRGVRRLLLDQLHKLPRWAEELRAIHETLSGMKVVFAASSVMSVADEYESLRDIVRTYQLRGLSLREYINVKAGLDLRRRTLEEVMRDYGAISMQVARRCDAGLLLDDYLQRGYYPFFLERSRYSGYLLKLMNMMIEVDIMMVKQIEVKYMGRIKALLYHLATLGDNVPNVSRLSKEIGTSRATVMNYIRYLASARLVDVMYKTDKGASGSLLQKASVGLRRDSRGLQPTESRKPVRIAMHNPNLLHAILPHRVERRAMLECFFLSALRPGHEVSVGERGCDYVVDGRWRFRIVERAPQRKQRGVCYLTDSAASPRDGLVPLWVLGLLY